MGFTTVRSETTYNNNNQEDKRPSKTRKGVIDIFASNIQTHQFFYKLLQRLQIVGNWL
jgi:hypothetical protein